MTIDTLIRQRKAGILCPECGSSDVEGGPFDSDHGHAWQDVACVDCSAEWRDVYQLHKVDVTNEGDERQPDEEPCGCHKLVNITNDLMVLNGYPDTDSINVIHTNNNWNITVWRDADETVHMQIVDNKDSTQVDLVLGQDGFTQRC